MKCGAIRWHQGSKYLLTPTSLYGGIYGRGKAAKENRKDGEAD